MSMWQQPSQRRRWLGAAKREPARDLKENLCYITSDSDIVQLVVVETDKKKTWELQNEKITERGFPSGTTAERESGRDFHEKPCSNPSACDTVPTNIVESDKAKAHDLPDGNIAQRRCSATATAEREEAARDIKERMSHIASDYNIMQLLSSGTTIVQGIGERMT